MKTILALITVFVLTACKESSKDSVHEAKKENKIEKKYDMINTNKKDIDFAVEAANGGMTEVEAAKLAVTKTGDMKVKEFAEMMIKDHTQLGEKLKAIAKSKHITLPATISNESLSKIKKLSEKAGHDFDKEYMEWMADDHDKDVSEFADQSKNAKDEDIRKFATDALPTLKEHQSQAHAINDNLK